MIAVADSVIVVLDESENPGGIKPDTRQAPRGRT